jgi:hypothetical protein
MWGDNPQLKKGEDSPTGYLIWARHWTTAVDYRNDRSQRQRMIPLLDIE